MPRRAMLFFRLGCLVLFLTGAMHLMGHLQMASHIPANDTERALDDLMKTYTRDLAGTPRSTHDLFMGMSLQFSLGLFALAAAGGMLSLARHPHPPRPAVAGMMAFLVAAMAVNSQLHFFIIPTACLAAAALCFTLAATFSASLAGPPRPA
jgi:hypothetical protein